MKNVHIRSFSGLYFPAFGLSMERYSASLHIQSECGKIRIGKTPNADTFRTVNVPYLSSLEISEKVLNKMGMKWVKRKTSNVLTVFIFNPIFLKFFNNIQRWGWVQPSFKFLYYINDNNET